jgi:outer membrane protein TolC
VAWALQHNPELAVARKQRGIAEANVVIARTYPFNPSWQPSVMGISGPESAGITNRVFVQNVLALEVEMRGQGRIRRAIADSALSRAELEIAGQELAIAVKTIRAFNAFVYRQDKYRLLETAIGFQERTAKTAKLLFDQGKLNATDRMVAEADLVDARAQRGPGEAQRVAAWNDLRRVLGTDRAVGSFSGRLESAGSVEDTDELIQAALRQRADLQALRVAVVEADQRARYEVANRFGNPTLGPKMELNETRVTFVGAALSFPIPVVNLRRGEIMLRMAERDKAVQDMRRVEVQAALDVKAAVARIDEAQKWEKYVRTESLPALQTTMEAFEKLFAAGDPGVNVLRLTDARRRLLRARDGYLDALWELSQARADLAAAVGDIELALPPRAPAPVPAAPEPVQAAGRPQLLAPVSYRE